MDIIADKRNLRKQMLAERAKLHSISKENYDQWICEQLFSIVLARHFNVIHAYIPMANEIDIAPFLQQLLNQHKTVVCPKTLTSCQLENRMLTSLQALETGIKGTQHPAATDVYEGNYNLIIVPGLAFDHQKYRLGYGGGYYDSFLASQPTAYKVGVFYPFQKVDQVPTEAHDVCLDEILVGRF